MPTRAPGANRSAASPRAVHDPDCLVPGNQRKPGVGELPVDDVQVGAADAAGRDRDEHLSEPRLGIGEVGRPQGLSAGIEHHGAHGYGFGVGLGGFGLGSITISVWAWLSSRFRSSSDAATSTRVVAVPAFLATTTTVTAAVCPAGSAAIVQLTGASPEQLPPAAEAATSLA